MTINNPKYAIGERIYHVTKESDEGVIINILYSLRFHTWVYVVTFKAGDSCELFEDEISRSKIF
jgi:hypothetical protein